jgi:hypothetical protein
MVPPAAKYKAIHSVAIRSRQPSGGASSIKGVADWRRRGHLAATTADHPIASHEPALLLTVVRSGKIARQGKRFPHGGSARKT